MERGLLVGILLASLVGVEQPVAAQPPAPAVSFPALSPPPLTAPGAPCPEACPLTCPPAEQGERSLFRKGQCSVQFLAGTYWMSSWGPEGPPLDYAPFAVRLGYQLNDPDPSTLLLFGTWEALFEWQASVPLQRFGSYITGPSLLLRGNVPIEGCRATPYFQFGGGLALTDAYKRRDQELIGQFQEFLLQAAIGVRFRVSENCTLDVEGGFQHISNAGIAEHNGGINNFGGSVGFTYFFPVRRR